MPDKQDKPEKTLDDAWEEVKESIQDNPKDERHGEDLPEELPT